MRYNENMKKSSKTSTIRRTLHYYWQEVKKYKWYSLGFFLLTPTVILIRNVFSVYVSADIIGKISDGISKEEIMTNLLPEVAIFLAIFAINSVLFEKLRIYFCWKMELKAMYDLSSKCFDTVCSQSMQFHSDRFSGSLVSQVNKFVSAFERFMDVIIWDILPTSTFIIATLLILWPYSPIYSIVLVSLIIVYCVIAGITSKKISHLNAEEASAQTKQTGQLADSISNIISVKSYAKEAHEHHRYANFQRASLNAGFSLMRATIKRDVMFSGVNVGINALVYIFLIFGSIWFGLPVMTLILILNYTQQILNELWNINHIFKDINRVFGDSEEMTKILDMADDVVDEPGAKPLILKDGSVNFDNIAFRHKEAKQTIFTDFSLEIKSGERVGLVGVSGSGKTTLTKLLLRFADVNAGEITIDGQNIRNITQKSLREAVAYVPQETSLFHRSIADNIAYAKPDASMEEILRAAKLANVDGFIKDLPDGYDTLVGERGVKLSGGQRQRIAIARAILKDAPILVLDEATSALDSESESAIQSALSNLMKGRTSIVIAHRLSTVADLDRIVVLKDGKIVEQGSHQELLNQRGEYSKLWSKQSGAFLDEK